MIFTLVGNKEVVVNSTPKERCFLSPSAESHTFLDTSYWLLSVTMQKQSVITVYNKNTIAWWVELLFVTAGLAPQSAPKPKLMIYWTIYVYVVAYQKRDRPFPGLIQFFNTNKNQFR